MINYCMNISECFKKIDPLRFFFKSIFLNKNYRNIRNFNPGFLIKDIIK